jgi:exoribonuclease R
MEVGVHIADVSHFVKPKTNLDKEAYFRATTVYLVQRAIPMLPRLLCEQLCSLNPDVDRLAFSVVWVMNPNAEIVGEPWFGKSIIRSRAKLAYEHAQAIIEARDWSNLPKVTMSKDTTFDAIKRDVLTFYNLSKHLRRKRYDNGALSIQSIKLWFALDDLGNPTKTGIYQIKDSNRLIEEVRHFQLF